MPAWIAATLHGLAKVAVTAAANRKRDVNKHARQRSFVLKARQTAFA
jgi:hypothetical protein